MQTVACLEYDTSSKSVLPYPLNLSWW